MTGRIKLMNEERGLSRRDDLQNFVAAAHPKNAQEWYFVIFGLQNSPYEGGYYVGTVTIGANYPFDACAIQMLTPSARFA
jgi:ubiquitin-conjugating enzyme E2 J2